MGSHHPAGAGPSQARSAMAGHQPQSGRGRTEHAGHRHDRHAGGPRKRAGAAGHLGVLRVRPAPCPRVVLVAADVWRLCCLLAAAARPHGPGLAAGGRAGRLPRTRALWRRVLVLARLSGDVCRDRPAGLRPFAACPQQHRRTGLGRRAGLGRRRICVGAVSGVADLPGLAVRAAGAGLGLARTHALALATAARCWRPGGSTRARRWP